MLKQSEVFLSSLQVPQSAKIHGIMGINFQFPKLELLVLTYTVLSPSHPLSPSIIETCLPSWSLSFPYHLPVPQSTRQSFPILFPATVSLISLGSQLSSLLLILFNLPENVLTCLITSLYPTSFLQGD